MASIGYDKEAFLAELEKLSEDDLRLRLATKIYGDANDKGALAREALLRKELARQAESERRREASQSEQIDIARSAKDAAWAAAKWAKIANIIAATALIVA